MFSGFIVDAVVFCSFLLFFMSFVVKANKNAILVFAILTPQSLTYIGCQEKIDL